MFKNAINKETRGVLEKIGSAGFAKKFYLAGGTALAIQLGHRESIDLDFFSTKKFLPREIKDELSSRGNLIVDYENEKTLDGSLDNVKVSFFHYDYRQLYPLIAFGKINLADERDISAMKIDAISSRGSKKDFVDLYFLLKKYSLPELLEFFEKKYLGIQYNKLHILKSLAFFEDAENDPMPVMLQDTAWEEVKKGISTELKKMIGK